jgi:hypothetical protein
MTALDTKRNIARRGRYVRFWHEADQLDGAAGGQQLTQRGFAVSKEI